MCTVRYGLNICGSVQCSYVKWSIHVVKNSHLIKYESGIGSVTFTTGIFGYRVRVFNEELGNFILAAHDVA